MEERLGIYLKETLTFEESREIYDQIFQTKLGMRNLECIEVDRTD